MGSPPCGNCVERSLPWPALWVTEIAVLAATGWTKSGESNDALQILGFWVFPLCPAVLLILGIVALVRWRRGGATNGT